MDMWEEWGVAVWCLVLTAALVQGRSQIASLLQGLVAGNSRCTFFLLSHYFVHFSQSTYVPIALAHTRED